MTSNNNSDDDSVESSDSSGPYDPCDIDEEVLECIKANDPDWDAFYVTFNGDRNPNFPFDPLSIDWEKEGFAISRSSHIKLLEIRDLQQETDEHYFYCERNKEERVRNAKAFYKAVAANRSIKYLTIEGNITYGLEMKDTVAILRPFVQSNNKLRSLQLSHFTLDARTTQILASALSNCAGSLRSFELKRCDGLTGRAMEKIINAMKVNSNITELSLDENDIDDDVGIVLGDALTTLSLKSLSLRGDYEMRSGSISPAGMEAISNGLSHNTTLETLDFWRFPITVNGGLSLAEAITNNSVLALKKLNLTCAVRSAQFAPSPEGWAIFFDFLSNSPLQDLQLGGNNISDDVIPSMVECLNSMTSLTDLCLWECSNVTTSGWTDFFRLLKNNMSLRKCEMYGNPISNVSVVAAMSSALCDGTGVESIFSSNHTLYRIESLFSFSMDPGIKLLLKMNENDDKVEVARQKIIKYYFLEESNLHELGRMDLGLLPRVLGYVDKYEPTRLYEIVRAIPSLVHNNEKTIGTKRKRKRRA
mmetsp:Transcript_19307/g.29745  ORF Transcript_19307/g.29745 Transcript_19307/m.29745 type:complete len:532 (-) Transcript_19307:1142-2737(-)